MKIKKRNFIFNIIFNIFSTIFPILLIPYIIGKIGVEKYGILSYFLSITLVISIFTELGIFYTGTKYIAKNKENKNLITNIIFSIYIVKFIVTVISFIITAVVYFLFFYNKYNILLICNFYLLLISQYLFPKWYFQGLGKFDAYSILGITSKILYAFLIIIYLDNASEYIYVPFLNSIANFFVIFIALFIIFKEKNLNIQYLNMKKILIIIKNLIKAGITLTISSSFSVLISQTPYITLGFLEEFKILGIYSFLDKIVQAAKNFLLAIYQVLYPYLVQIHKKNLKDFYGKWFYITKMTSFLSLGIFLIIMFIPCKIIFLFFNIECKYIFILKILSITIFTYNWINLTGYLNLLLFGKYNALLISQLIGLLTILIFSLLFTMHKITFTIYLISFIFTDLSIILVRAMFIIYIRNKLWK